MTELGLVGIGTAPYLAQDHELPSGVVYLPSRVWVEERDLRWKFGMEPAAPADTDALLAFTELATPESVAAFAKKYGCLENCEEHNLPRSHNRTGIDQFGCDMRREGSLPDSHIVESLETWYQFARQARSILNISGALSAHRLPDFADWKELRPIPGRDPSGSILGATKDDENSQILTERKYLSDIVNEWLKIGDVRMTLTWEQRAARPEWKFRGDGLFGSLALRLAVQVSADAGPVTHCSGCQTPVAPRSNRPGQRPWCRDCREAGKPQAAASMDYRNRKRQGTPSNPRRGAPRRHKSNN